MGFHFAKKNIQYWLVFAVCLFCIGITSRSVLRHDFFRPHDYTHAARIIEMQRSLQAAELPVRWSQNFGFGYGMPLFNFYAPFPYYLAQLPNLFFGVIASIKWLYVANAVLTFAGMYLLAKEIWGKTGGVLSASVFTLSTYRALDLYVRGAIGEVYAMVFIPFIFLGLMYWIRQKKQNVLLIAVPIALTLLSHNLIGMVTVGLTVIFGPLLLCVYGLETKKEIARKLLYLLISILLGIGLSAFYVVPAFIEKNFTRVEQTITTGDFDFHHHFLAVRQLIWGNWGYGGSIPGIEDGMSFALGVLPLILVGLSGLIILWKGSRTHKKIFGLFFVFFILFCALTTNKTLFIWENISVFKFMQFPWRMLTFAHFFMALLIGSIGVFAKKKSGKIIVSLLILTMGLFHASYFVPERFLSDLSAYYRTDPDFIRTTLSQTLNDYLPPSIIGAQFPLPITHRLELAVGEGKIKIAQDVPASLFAHVTCVTPCMIKTNTFEFPGWRAYLNGVSLPMNLEDGIPSYILEIPKGEHELLIRLERTPTRGIAELVTILSIAIMCTIALKKQSLQKN